MIIDTILSINETILNIKAHIQTLFTSSKFLLLHSEFMIHHTRIRHLMKQMQHDMTLIREYWNIHTTGRLNPNSIDPIQLRQELFKVNKQLPTQLSSPENPRSNIWHYYKFLTVTTINHDNKIILMIKIPLIDLDSSVTLYKIYNLPIFHHEISKSLIYNIEGNNLAVTKDNEYATILSDTEFIKCTLAQGHICNLNTALNHNASNPMCLTALFLKDNNKIQNQCKLAVTNITGPEANYLDQGNWAISVTEPNQMAIKCSDHTHIKTLQLPITLINLEPVFSAFSSLIKLPPYFKQYSKGFHVALRTVNLHLPNSPHLILECGTHLIYQKIEPIDTENLKKLTPAPAIPISPLRTQISSFRQIDTDKSTSWVYYVGGVDQVLVLYCLL